MQTMNEKQNAKNYQQSNKQISNYEALRKQGMNQDNMGRDK